MYSDTVVIPAAIATPVNFGNYYAHIVNKIEDLPTDNALYVCYKTGTSAVTTVACGNVGTVAAGNAGYPIPSTTSNGVFCTMALADNFVITLGWTSAATASAGITHIRFRVCSAASDIRHVDNPDMPLKNLMTAEVLGLPLTLQLGDPVSVSFAGWTTGTEVWVCYTSSFSNPPAVPMCGTTPGVAVSISQGTSGQASPACTALLSLPSSGSALLPSVSLTWDDVNQDYFRAIPCTANGAAHIATNGVVTFGERISVSITPTSAYQGAALTATYSGYVLGGDIWLCYNSSQNAIMTAPACAAAGTAGSAATISGTYACTPRLTTGAPVVLTWTDPTYDNVRVRACTTATDLSQGDNANVALTRLTLSPTYTGSPTPQHGVAPLAARVPLKITVPAGSLLRMHEILGKTCSVLSTTFNNAPIKCVLRRNTYSPTGNTVSPSTSA